MEDKTITFGEKTYTLDEYGFLNPADQWDTDFAEGMAKTLGIYGGLTERHWKFIHYMRKKYLEEKTIPVMVNACAENKVHLNELKALFPTGYHRGACKIAGINYEFMRNTNWGLCSYEVCQKLSEAYKMTPLGFLEDFHQWNERFASLIVSEWLPHGLTQRHMKVLYFLRDYYENTKNIPTIIETCRENNLTLEEIRDLFPEGYRRGACRIAGLPFFP